MPATITLTVQIVVAAVAGIILPVVLAARKWLIRERKRVRKEAKRDLMLSWLVDRFAEAHDVDPPPFDLQAGKTVADGGKDGNGGRNTAD